MKGVKGWTTEWSPPVVRKSNLEVLVGGVVEFRVFLFISKKREAPE